MIPFTTQDNATSSSTLPIAVPSVLTIVQAFSDPSVDSYRLMFSCTEAFSPDGVTAVCSTTLKYLRAIPERRSLHISRNPFSGGPHRGSFHLSHTVLHNRTCCTILGSRGIWHPDVSSDFMNGVYANSHFIALLFVCAFSKLPQ